MHRLRASPWQFTGLCILGVLIGTSGLLTVTAATVPEDVLNASDVADRESDSYSLDAFVWRDSMPLVVTGPPAVSTSATRLSDGASPVMANLYLNDMACNRQTAPLVTCQTAWLQHNINGNTEVWSSDFPPNQSTVRGGPGWAVGSVIEVVLKAMDSEGSFYVSTNTTIQSTQ